MISLQNERWCTCASNILTTILHNIMHIQIASEGAYMYNVHVHTKPVEVSVLRSMAFFSESVKPSLSVTAVSQRSRYSRKVSCSHWRCSKNSVYTMYNYIHTQQHSSVMYILFVHLCLYTVHVCTYSSTLNRKSLAVRNGCWNIFR